MILFLSLTFKPDHKLEVNVEIEMIRYIRNDYLCGMECAYNQCLEGLQKKVATKGWGKVLDSYLVVFFCFAITLHNIEEAIWLPKWSQQSSTFHKPVTSSEFHFAVIFITVLAYLSAFSFLYMPESDLAKWIFIGFLGSMILNAVFPHLIATVLMKKYAPGLLTGLLLNLPINSLVLYQMFSNHLITWTELIISTFIVAFILISIIPFLFKMGGKIAPS